MQVTLTGNEGDETFVVSDVPPPPNPTAETIEPLISTNGGDGIDVVRVLFSESPAENQFATLGFDAEKLIVDSTKLTDAATHWRLRDGVLYADPSSCDSDDVCRKIMENTASEVQFITADATDDSLTVDTQPTARGMVTATIDDDQV